MSEREAEHYERRADGAAACRLCPHLCLVGSGESGRCDVRQNLGGVLYATNYQEVGRLEVEPIERLPLYHFRPGQRALSIGSLGDSFPVELSPGPRATPPADAPRWATAREVLDIAHSHRANAIACIGGEPFMWFEQWREIATAARAEGFASIAFTNAFSLPAPVAEVAPLLDAVNVSVLGASDLYRRRAKVDAAPVFETVRAFAMAGIHIELTLVALAGETDRPGFVEEVTALAAGFGSPPLHIASPIHSETAANVKDMVRLADALRARLPYAYLSTVYASEPERTICRTCKAPLVERTSSTTQIAGLSAHGACVRCGDANSFRL